MTWCIIGSDPGGEEVLSTCSDRHMGPPSFLYNGYRVSLPGVKRPGRGLDHPTSSVEVKERIELYLYSRAVMDFSRVSITVSRVNITFSRVSIAFYRACITFSRVKITFSRVNITLSRASIAFSRANITSSRANITFYRVNITFLD
jgi:hypothetical protein